MITFLPYEDFGESARCLDYKRLGKQRSEALVTLNALVQRTGLFRYPGVQMWYGYEDALRAYHNAILIEWMLRGYNNGMRLQLVNESWDRPNWLGDELLHSCHRARLLQKDPEFYSRYGWTDKKPLAEGYYWPLSDRSPHGRQAIQAGRLGTISGRIISAGERPGGGVAAGSRLPPAPGRATEQAGRSHPRYGPD